MLVFLCNRSSHSALQPLLSSNIRAIAAIVSCRVILNLRYIAGAPQKWSLASLMAPPDTNYNEQMLASMEFWVPSESEILEMRTEQNP
jgi:hypothetical protein